MAAAEINTARSSPTPAGIPHHTSLLGHEKGVFAMKYDTLKRAANRVCETYGPYIKRAIESGAPCLGVLYRGGAREKWLRFDQIIES
jgi:hypothetical protein